MTTDIDDLRESLSKYLENWINDLRLIGLDDSEILDLFAGLAQDKINSRLKGWENKISIHAWHEN